MFVSLATTAAANAAAEKPRTILTTDGEIDDIDTMIRWFLYANEMEPATPGVTREYTAHAPVALTFKQSIASTDALRTGSYSKTLTFTLSTTTP